MPPSERAGERAHDRVGSPVPPIKPRTRLRPPGRSGDPGAPIYPPKISPPTISQSNHPFRPAKPVVPSTGQRKTENANDNILTSKIRELIVRELQSSSNSSSPAKPGAKPKVRRTSAPPVQPASNQNRAGQVADRRYPEWREWHQSSAPAPAAPHIATYHRELPVGLARLYETVLDWRNPPPLHGSSYAKIDGLASGDSGWLIRATRTNPKNQTFELELQLDRFARRWVCKVLSGPEAGTQIWTQAIPIGRRHTDIAVDFFVPGVTRSNFSETTGIYSKLYTDLFDRDIDRMLARQTQLDQPHPESAKHGKTVSTLAGRMDLIRGTRAYLFEAGRKQSTAHLEKAKFDGHLIAHVLECDHMRNAASTWSVTDHIVQCPHHKVKFDLRTGGRVRNYAPGYTPPPRIQLDPRSHAIVSLMAETKPAHGTRNSPVPG